MHWMERSLSDEWMHCKALSAQIVTSFCLPPSSASRYPLAPALLTCNTCHWSQLLLTCACQGEIIGTRLHLISELLEAVTHMLFMLLYY